MAKPAPNFLNSIDGVHGFDGINEPAPRKGKKRVNKDAEYDPTFDKPDHQDMAVDAAHAAHREVMRDWVAGRASTKKMNQSHTRLVRAVKLHGGKRK